MSRFFTPEGGIICTEHVCPPIPKACRMDWVAWLDDDPEFGCGHGDTEQEAVTNLLMRWEWRETMRRIEDAEDEQRAYEDHEGGWGMQ